jgi:hypothetical protein
MKRLALFLFTAVLFATNQLSAQTIHCLWETTPINVDGKPDEWPQPFNYYDGNTKLQFAFANDTGSMYVCLKITDDPTQLRLFNGGLGIWVDPKGKRKETMGISFPLKGDRVQGGEGGKHKRQSETMEGMDPGTQKSDALRLKQNAFLTQLTLRVKGFNGVPEQVLPLKNDFGINVGFGWDSLNILTIEYKFPIALVLGHNLSPADTLKPISVAFIEPALETIKMDKEEDNSITGPSSSQNGMNRNGMGGMNNGMNGGMGGRGGMGGSGGGMNRNSMPSQNPATQEQKLWSKVVLSLQ